MGTQLAGGWKGSGVCYCPRTPQRMTFSQQPSPWWTTAATQTCLGSINGPPSRNNEPGVGERAPFLVVTMDPGFSRRGGSAPVCTNLSSLGFYGGGQSSLAHLQPELGWRIKYAHTQNSHPHALSVPNLCIQQAQEAKMS